MGVSIHAPAWGATPPTPQALRSRWFQSTHPRGVRLGISYQRAPENRGFNPRTRVGCDRPKRCQSYGIFPVSIHAPAWGATSCNVGNVSSIEFQSTHPRGVRLDGQRVAVRYAEFQSTHPRGVRRDKAIVNAYGVFVSIHAPAWGATKANNLTLYPHMEVSIHAPAWGATDDFVAAYRDIIKFQSTHPRGVRQSHLTSG